MFWEFPSTFPVDSSRKFTAFQVRHWNEETKLFKTEREVSILIIVSHYFLNMMLSRMYLALNRTFKYMLR